MSIYTIKIKLLEIPQKGQKAVSGLLNNTLNITQLSELGM